MGCSYKLWIILFFISVDFDCSVECDGGTN